MRAPSVTKVSLTYSSLNFAFLLRKEIKYAFFSLKSIDLEEASGSENSTSDPNSFNAAVACAHAFMKSFMSKYVLLQLH